jgi:hypothetical protein
VTTSAELRKAIREMAEELADGVVQLIATMSLEQLAAMTRRGGGAVAKLKASTKGGSSKSDSARSAAAKSSKKDGAARSRSAKAGRGGADARSSSGRGSKVKASKVKSAPRRKLNRRDGDEIEKLRQGVLSVLREAGDWMPARDIGRALGDGVKADELSFPINYLRDRELVEKVGDRSQARYRITAAGRAYTGSFVKASSDAVEEDSASDAAPVA